MNIKNYKNLIIYIIKIIEIKQFDFMQEKLPEKVINYFINFKKIY